MDDLTVLLLGAAAVGAGILLASGRDLSTFFYPPTEVTIPTTCRECAGTPSIPGGISLTPEVNGRVIPGLSASDVLTAADQPALQKAIQRRYNEIPHTPGTHKLYPYYDQATGKMIDIGYQGRSGVRGPLSYVSYPVGGTPAQGTWSPI